LGLGAVHLRPYGNLHFFDSFHGTRSQKLPEITGSRRRLPSGCGKSWRQRPRRLLGNGQFDGVVLFDAPDEETATSLMLALAAQGNVQTTTLRAFGAHEMKAIADKAAKIKL
jgi:hypothetical protein